MCGYLHEVSSPSVVHRNFKSGNILLDDELNPHLSYCGITSLSPSSERQGFFIPVFHNQIHFGHVLWRMLFSILCNATRSIFPLETNYNNGINRFQVSTQMLSSFGYSAPEYAMSGIYTAKSDVYSFGVVMLELLTGRKPLDRYCCCFFGLHLFTH